MRVVAVGAMLVAAAVGLGACGGCKEKAPDLVVAERIEGAASAPAGGDFAGFDLNEYPGDAAMARMRKLFAYTGYWLTPPPGEKTTNWLGKRAALRAQGYGFLVLADGRFEKEIKASKLGAKDFGAQDAMKAVATARAEGFPARTIIFLDQEEGGRLTEAQVGYLFGWTEEVAKSAFRPGVYASGQAVPDGPGKTITTVNDIREHVASGHLHPIAFWVYQDACAPKGPAPGCTLTPPAAGASGSGGFPEVMAWQYAQSPRRPEITQSCAKTYGKDGNCTMPGEPTMLMDLNVAASGDPSGGR